MPKSEYDIPLAKAQIIWAPVDNPELPDVEVVSPDYDDDGRYYSSWGACNQEFVDAPPQEQVNLLMRQFIHMVVADNADSNQVHRALMMIPEYRIALADFGTIDPTTV